MLQLLSFNSIEPHPFNVMLPLVYWIFYTRALLKLEYFKLVNRGALVD